MDIRAKLIELLRTEHPIMSGDVTVGVFQMPMEDAEGLAGFLIANGVTFATGNNVGRWIPVTERLPDEELWAYQERYGQDNMEVLVMIKGAKAATTLYYDADGDFSDDNGDTWLVTHWQPMPEPPEDVAYG